MCPYIVLHELDIPFKVIQMKGGARGYESVDGRLTHEEFLKINPDGYVPVLSVDDVR